MSMVFGALPGKSQDNNRSTNNNLDEKCRFFAQGRCKFGDRCYRSHDALQEEVKTSSTVTQFWQHTSTGVLSSNWRDRGGNSKGKQTVPVEADTTTTASWRAESSSCDVAIDQWGAYSRGAASKGAGSAETTNTGSWGSSSSCWSDSGHSATSTSTSTWGGPFGWGGIKASTSSGPHAPILTTSVSRIQVPRHTFGTPATSSNILGHPTTSSTSTLLRSHVLITAPYLNLSPGNIPPNEAKKPCFSWAKSGTCQFGNKCRYEHDTNVPSRPNREMQWNAARIDEARIEREAAEAEFVQKVQRAQEEADAELTRQAALQQAEAERVRARAQRAKEQAGLLGWTRTRRIAEPAQKAQEEAVAAAGVAECARQEAVRQRARDTRDTRVEIARRVREVAEAAQKVQEEAAQRAAQAEARRVREARQEEARRVRQAEREAEEVEAALRAQQAQEKAARQVEAQRVWQAEREQEEAEAALRAQQAQERIAQQVEARRVREARQEARRVRQAEQEQEAAEAALKAQQAQENATRQAEVRRAREAQQEEARRARQAEQEARMVEQAKEEAAMTMQHIVFDFTLVTFSAGLAIQEVLLGFESCRITIKNLPIDATIKEVRELFTQQGIEPGRFHVLRLARAPAGRQQAFVIGHEDLKIVAIGLEEIEFRQERLSFEIMDHSDGDGMAASALGTNTRTRAWQALNRPIEESLDASNIVPSTGDTGEAICPICYDAVTLSIKLGCGHAYCSACIRHFLTSASTFPLVCMGDKDKCHAPIPIPVIQRFLPIQQFTNLLETAFITYIDHHPQNFKYCTTPDCRQVYRCTTSETASSIRCSSCFSSVCSACHEEGHEGMTCAERKLNNDPEEQERLNDELAVQSGYKKCPQCAVWIEKIDGCNHMACKCGADICWVCMRIFDAQSVYGHVNTAHGGM